MAGKISCVIPRLDIPWQEQAPLLCSKGQRLKHSPRLFSQEQCKHLCGPERGCSETPQTLASRCFETVRPTSYPHVRELALTHIGRDVVRGYQSALVLGRLD